MGTERTHFTNNYDNGIRRTDLEGSSAQVRGGGGGMEGRERGDDASNM